MKDYCYYFCWCTWMFSDELHRYWPEAEIVCKGYLANHKVLWMDASGRGDRGWCHLDNGTQSWGNTVEGTIAKVPMKYYRTFRRFLHARLHGKRRRRQLLRLLVVHPFGSRQADEGPLFLLG